MILGFRHKGLKLLYEKGDRVRGQCAILTLRCCSAVLFLSAIEMIKTLKHFAGFRNAWLVQFITAPLSRLAVSPDLRGRSQPPCFDSPAVLPPRLYFHRARIATRR